MAKKRYKIENFADKVGIKKMHLAEALGIPRQQINNLLIAKNKPYVLYDTETYDVSIIMPAQKSRVLNTGNIKKLILDSKD